MDFTFRENHPTNTVILEPSGQPIYHVNTPSSFNPFKLPDTTIRRVDGTNDFDVATIQWERLTKPLILTVRGRGIQMSRSGMFSVSESFQAADGQMYKWKIKGGFPLLVRSDDSKSIVATFSAPSSIFSMSRPVVLSVAPAGMGILDDLIATFIYMETKRRKRKQRARRRAGGTGGGMSMGGLSGGSMGPSMGM
ncbi:hypothetical protein PLICRDRAFT_41120 [Plicaturopsis crispa FD-325 SS-3]|nr:hypothetical protein PLICRDRAFT_41120 [Plicaturopsis crispa FD-325 SS-3]